MYREFLWQSYGCGSGQKLWGHRYTSLSAGIEKHGVNPVAVKAMQEIDINMDGHYSKTPHDLGEPSPFCVITVCGHANESCPTLPGIVSRLHVGFDDPPKLAANATDEADAMIRYSRVRDEIAAFIAGLPTALEKL